MFFVTLQTVWKSVSKFNKIMFYILCMKVKNSFLRVQSKIIQYLEHFKAISEERCQEMCGNKRTLRDQSFWNGYKKNQQIDFFPPFDLHFSFIYPNS